MKTVLKVVLLAFFLPGGIFSDRVYADPPGGPPPPPGGGHGSGNNAPPAGAPIDGGLGILVLLGTAFGGLKIIRSGQGSKKTG